MHKYAPRGPGELSPEEELSLHHYVSKKMPDRLHVAKLIAGYEVRPSMRASCPCSRSGRTRAHTTARHQHTPRCPASASPALSRTRITPRRTPALPSARAAAPAHPQSP